jgi:hypothetical protein
LDKKEIFIKINKYPLEKRSVGVELGGREVSVGREKPASLAATMTGRGGLSDGNDKTRISIFKTEKGSLGVALRCGSL